MESFISEPSESKPGSFRKTFALIYLAISRIVAAYSHPPGKAVGVARFMPSPEGSNGLTAAEKAAAILDTISQWLPLSGIQRVSCQRNQPPSRSRGAFVTSG
jgi:hypothetical protein